MVWDSVTSQWSETGSTICSLQLGVDRIIINSDLRKTDIVWDVQTQWKNNAGNILSVTQRD